MHPKTGRARSPVEPGSGWSDLATPQTRWLPMPRRCQLAGALARPGEPNALIACAGRSPAGEAAHEKRTKTRCA